MHDLLAEVFPYLVAFFVLDGFLYIRPGQVALVSSFGRRFRLLEPGMHLFPPWPDVRVVLAEDLLIAASASGLHAQVKESAGPGIVPRPEQFGTTDLAAVADGQIEGRSIVGRDGRRLCLAPSTSAARAIRATAIELRTRGDHAALVDLLGGPARATWVSTRRERLEKHLKGLRALVGSGWVLFFGAVPAALYVAEAPTALYAALAACFVSYVAILIRSNVALRDVGVGARDRLQALSAALLFPPGAFHITAALERDLYAPATGASIVAAFLEREPFLRFAARRLRRIQALATSAAGAAEAVWRIQYRCTEMAVRRLGTSPEAVLAAAEKRTDETAASWCPVCGAEYRAGTDTCSDCGFGLVQYG